MNETKQVMFACGHSSDQSAPVGESHYCAACQKKQEVITWSQELEETARKNRQKQVVRHILAQPPHLVSFSGGDGQYVISTESDGMSIIAAFRQWGTQSIVDTTEMDSGVRATCLRLSAYEMDLLCASWLNFQVEYSLPREEVQDDSLGDLEDHPF